MEDNKDNYNGEVEWVVPEYEELLNKQNEGDIEKVEDLEEKNEEEKEIKNLDEQIEQKMQELEEIQKLVDYYESGEAFKEIEEDLSNGLIDEKEYEEKKSTIDIKYKEVKEKLKITKNELQELLKQKEKISGVKQKDIIDEEREEPINKKEEIVDDTSKYMEETSKGSEEKKENTKTEENSNTDSTSGQEVENRENEQEVCKPVPQRQMEVYGKQNRFVKFIKKALEKLKRIVGIKKVQNIEENIINQVNSDGYNIDTAQFDVPDLGDQLSELVCSNEEILQNYERREAIEQQELGLGKTNIEKNNKTI